jgi:hypothetical protein
MRVALISNMNNNYFALLRYLRDMGIDAHLFRFIDEYSNFTPDNDSWEMNKWEAYIHVLPFTYYNYTDTYANYPEQEVKQALQGFDILMGSGPTPAYLSRIGIYLDVFLAYKTGIEYCREGISWRRPKLAIQTNRFNQLQQRSIGKAFCMINSDYRPITLNMIRKTGVKTIDLGLPMVYPECIPANAKMDALYIEGMARMEKSDFVICHLGRHLWKQTLRSKLKMIPFINNNANNKVIEAFARLIQEEKADNALLVLFEYGPQVAFSKQLISELGIGKQVLWFPITPRRIIMQIIQKCSLGIGDIDVGYWGGKAMEFLSSGVPLINSISKEQKMLYEKNTSHAVPPFIEINKIEELAGIFKTYYTSPKVLRERAEQSLAWYHQYDGLKLAESIRNLFEQILKEKRA